MRVVVRGQQSLGEMTAAERKANACRIIQERLVDVIDLSDKLDRLSNVIGGFGSGTLNADMHRAAEELEGVRHELLELNTAICEKPGYG